jgi:hypothetical protein
MKKVLRYLGLGLVTLVAGIYGMIMVGGLFEDSPTPHNWETLGMTILSSLAVLSVIVSWLRLWIGAWMVVGVGVLFTIFALVSAGRMHWIAVMASGFPLLLGGGLMLLSLHYPQKPG